MRREGLLAELLRGFGFAEEAEAGGGAAATKGEQGASTPRRHRAVQFVSQALKGDGGVGKTTLAMLFVERHGWRFPGGVFFVLAETAETLASGFKKLATKAGFAAEVKSRIAACDATKEDGRRSIAEATKRALGELGTADGSSSSTTPIASTRSRRAGSTFPTMRRAACCSPRGAHWRASTLTDGALLRCALQASVCVTKLDAQDARDLLEQWTLGGRVQALCRRQVQAEAKLLELLDGHALSIRIAGAAISKKAGGVRPDFVDYVADFEEQLIECNSDMLREWLEVNVFDAA